jgi:ATP diphosphatase
MQPSGDIRRLIEIMAALRDPVRGCPWDQEQTFASIAPFTIEEAYEVADAIERGGVEDLREELGDLLLQVVFHARMAEEAGLFDFGGVVEVIAAKLIRRHPHVFGDATAASSGDVKALWGRIKADEKRAKRASSAKGAPAPSNPGALDGVPLALPALSRALKLQEKAGKVGFDWNDARAVLDKIREEVAEVEAEIAAGSAEALSGEVGDLLFAVANLARHLKVDPEAALRSANWKFERRFAHIESRLAARGLTAEGASLEDMEQLWAEAKAEEGLAG